MDRFDAKLTVLQKSQDDHLVRVRTLLDRAKGPEFSRARRYHDGLLDPLARSLLNAMNEQGQGDSYPARLLCMMVDATCLDIIRDNTQIREAVNAGWEVVIAIDDVDYIHTFTSGAEDEGRFRLVAHALQTIKAWILVSEAALEQAACGFMNTRLASMHLSRYLAGKVHRKGRSKRRDLGGAA